MPLIIGLLCIQVVFYWIKWLNRYFVNCNRKLKTKDQLDVTCYFYFTSYALNMFQTLIYPSSGAYDYSVELPHWSYVLGLMCVGVSVWLVWRGMRVVDWSLQHEYHANPTTPKHQHTSNQDHTTNVVIQQNSRKLLMMDILMSETCWAHKKWNKNNKWRQVGLSFSTITMMHVPINIRCNRKHFLFDTNIARSSRSKVGIMIGQCKNTRKKSTACQTDCV